MIVDKCIELWVKEKAFSLEKAWFQIVSATVARLAAN